MLASYGTNFKLAHFISFYGKHNDSGMLAFIYTNRNNNPKRNDPSLYVKTYLYIANTLYHINATKSTKLIQRATLPDSVQSHVRFIRIRRNCFHFQSQRRFDAFQWSSSNAVPSLLHPFFNSVTTWNRLVAVKDQSTSGSVHIVPSCPHSIVRVGWAWVRNQRFVLIMSQNPERCFVPCITRKLLCAHNVGRVRIVGCTFF